MILVLAIAGTVPVAIAVCLYPAAALLWVIVAAFAIATWLWWCARREIRAAQREQREFEHYVCDLAVERLMADYERVSTDWQYAES